MSVISCLTWVKRGLAAEEPQKVELSAADLDALMQRANAAGIEEEEEEEDGSNSEQLESGTDSEGDMDLDEEETDKLKASDNKDEGSGEFADLAEFNMDDYDQEDNGFDVGGLNGLVYHTDANRDTYITSKSALNDEEEKDDFKIRQSDNMVLVGQTEGELSRLEVYVYEEEENNMYIHHDMILGGIPLCLESIENDPTDTMRSANLVAVGTMLPTIEIWDVDVVDGIDPVMTLGQLPSLPSAAASSGGGSNFTKSKKKNSKNKKTKNNNSNNIKNNNNTSTVDPMKSHTDAVLGLSWNKPNRNLLASCSADKTVKLWDLTEAACIYSFSHHTDKVQSIDWNPAEASIFVSGGFDKRCCLVDSRIPNQVLSWNVSSDVENVKFNPFSPEQFVASTEDGMVFCFDARKSDAPLYKIKAHDMEVCGLSFSKHVPGCLVTTSGDKVVKVWDITDNKPTCVSSQQLDLGPIYAVGFSPDSPYVVAAGGGKGEMNIWSIAESGKVRKQFE